MQYNVTDVAKTVLRWTSLGVDLPKSLETALDRFEALQLVEVGYQPVLDVEKVTPKNAEEKVREFAEVLANHLPLNIEGARVSVLESAKRWAVEEAAQVVKREAARAVPEIIEALAPAFEEHAAAYSEAVLKLPEKVSSDALVTAGPDALAAYGVARQEAAEINKVSGWIGSTADVLNIPSGSEGFLHVLAPDDAAQLAQLDSAGIAAGRTADRTYRAINPVYFTAVRLGVPFKINTVKDARALRKDLAITGNKVSFA